MPRSNPLLALVPAATLLLPSLPIVASRGYDLTASRLNSGIFYADVTAYRSSAFGLYVQSPSAQGVIASVAKEYLGKGKSGLTVISPDNDSFGAYITGLGGNTSDPTTLIEGDWDQRWADVYPYFFVPGTLVAKNLTEETTVVDTAKRSAIGDWYIPMGFFRDPAQSSNETYNGTAVGGPYGSGQILVPDTPVGPPVPDASIQIISYWPTIPKSLSDTVKDLNVSSWDEVKRRVPTLAALDSHHNVTLFLPPEATVSSALALSDADLATFFASHVVADRVVAPSVAKTYSTSAGADQSLVVSIADGVTVNAGTKRGFVMRDVLCDGGIIQAIDGPLVPLPARNTAQKRQEL